MKSTLPQQKNLPLKSIKKIHANLRLLGMVCDPLDTSKNIAKYKCLVHTSLQLDLMRRFLKGGALKTFSPTRIRASISNTE